MYQPDERGDQGTLTVYAGPMWAGKSTKLIDTLQAYDSYMAFKPEADDRYDGIKTHDHDTHEGGMDAVMVPDDDPRQMFAYVEQRDMDAIGIDEAQFFNGTFADTVYQLREDGYEVIVAGLDKDFKKEAFGAMPELLGDADEVEQLTAYCEECGDDAEYTQRLIKEDGEKRPAPYDGPQVLPGEEMYEPRCGEHHELPMSAEAD